MKFLLVALSLFYIGCEAGAKETVTTDIDAQQKVTACGVISSSKDLSKNEKYFLNSIKKFTWTSVDGGKFKAVTTKKDAGN
jgi:hypothetical protein